MPILQVELVGKPSGRSKNLARLIADAAAKVLKVPPGRVWGRLRVLPRKYYAECGGKVHKDIQPVFVELLKAVPAPRKILKREAMLMAEAIGKACARPAENVHIFYEPPAVGRAAFGGRLLCRP